MKGRQIECRDNSNDSEGRLMSICFIAGRSLNQFMVKMGWAQADRAITSMCNGIEKLAQAGRLVLWSSD
ncbi:MAG: thermonuclease family protein [Rhodospirillaceae bacterium]|nr:thermonuclease family protein [Rhodospirillaceae bacterium]